MRCLTVEGTKVEEGIAKGGAKVANMAGDDSVLLLLWLCDSSTDFTSEELVPCTNRGVPFASGNSCPRCGIAMPEGKHPPTAGEVWGGLPRGIKVHGRTDNPKGRGRFKHQQLLELIPGSRFRVSHPCGEDQGPDEVYALWNGKDLVITDEP